MYHLKVWQHVSVRFLYFLRLTCQLKRQDSWHSILVKVGNLKGWPWLMPLFVCPSPRVPMRVRRRGWCAGRTVRTLQMAADWTWAPLWTIVKEAVKMGVGGGGGEKISWTDLLCHSDPVTRAAGGEVEGGKGHTLVVFFSLTFQVHSLLLWIHCGLSFLRPNPGILTNKLSIKPLFLLKYIFPHDESVLSFTTEIERTTRRQSCSPASLNGTLSLKAIERL